VKFFDKLNTPRVVVAVLVLFVLVDGLLFFRHQRLESTTTEPEAVSSSALASKEEATTAQESTTPSAASKQGASSTAGDGTTSPTASTTGESGVLRVTLTVVDTPSWLTVREDGLPVLSELADPGFSQEFDADREVSVDAGNGGAVQATVDGQDEGRLASTPEVTSRTFTR
jgi:cytoskeletal protein RodZ